MKVSPAQLVDMLPTVLLILWVVLMCIAWPLTLYVIFK